MRITTIIVLWNILRGHRALGGVIGGEVSQHKLDNKTIVFALLEKINARPIVRDVIHAAYNDGYEEFSDGITLMPELAFRGFGMKHPAGVGHDWLYFMGVKNPFIEQEGEGDEYRARKWADSWFFDALQDFGHPVRAWLWWAGLRIGAWHGWNCHRNAGHPMRGPHL